MSGTDKDEAMSATHHDEAMSAHTTNDDCKVVAEMNDDPTARRAL